MNIKDRLKTFFGKYKEQTYKKGEIFIRAGESPKGIYFLTKGIVNMYTISSRGEEVTVNIFRQHAFFPMSWALHQTENNYFYEAATDIVVHRAPASEVVGFLKKEPEVVFDLLERVYSGIDGLLLRMTYLMAGNAYERLIIELVIAAKRFGTYDMSTKSYQLNISEIELSHQTGLTRETISREMKQLKKKNLVQFDKHQLIIQDLTLLENQLVGEM